MTAWEKTLSQAEQIKDRSGKLHQRKKRELMDKTHGSMRNMTEGSPTGHILAFAMPLVLGSLLQQLYNMVDSWVVGNFVGSGALAAVGMAFPVMAMFLSLFIGIGNGGTVVIAQFFGAGHMDKVRDTVDSIYTAFVVCIIPITVLAVVLVEPIMGLMQVEASAWEETRIYLMIIGLGMIGNVGYNITAGILSGLGNSKSTLLFLGIAAVINTVLDLAFVLLFGMGVVGVALATIIAQAISWIFSLFYVNRNYPEIAIHPFSFRFSRNLFAQVMKIGIPSGLQMAMTSMGVMSVMSKANSFGKEFTAGYNVGGKIDTVTFLFIQSVSSAVTAFVGQNIGAQKLDRVRKGVNASVLLAIGWCFLTMVLIIPFRSDLVGIFSPEPEVIYAGSCYLKAIMLGYPLFAGMFILNAALRGAGDSVFPMVTTTIAMIILRVPCVYWMADRFGSGAMFWGFLPGWAVGISMAFWEYLSGRWKRHAVLPDETDG